MDELIAIPDGRRKTSKAATTPPSEENAATQTSEYIVENQEASIDEARVNTVQGVTIYTDDYNNTIYNYASNVKIYSGAGNDYVNSNVYYGSYGYVTVDGGTGEDTLTNNDPFVSLNGGEGNDYISFNNFYKGVTVNGGEDNDTIFSKGSSSLGALYQFSYYDGKDTVYGYNSNDTISLDNCYYALSTVGSDVMVSLLSGDTMTLLDAKDKTVKIKGGTLYRNDGKYLANYASNSWIYGTAYKDTIYNYANSVTVSVGADKDYVYNTGSNSSINGGEGDDTVYNTGAGSQILLGEGNDSLNSWASGAITAYGGNGNDFIYNSSLGNGAYFDGGNGADTFLNIADRVRFYGSYGTDSIENWGNSVTVAGESDNDTLVNRSFANDSTWGQNNSVSGGYGNDVISLYGGAAGTTVNGGTGNDTVYNDNLSSRNGVLYQFTYGDGNDVIKNYSSNDTVSLNGDYYEQSTIGNNVVIKLIDSGETISLVGASDKTVYVTGGKKLAPVYNYNKNSLVSGSDYNDSLYNYAGGVTLKGNYGDDILYNSTSSSYTINNSYGYVTVDGGYGNDSIQSNDPYVSLNGGAGNDTITSGNWQGVTVNGNLGNDKIYANNNSYGVLYRYASGDGLDTIYGYESKDTITVTGASSWSTVTSNNNVIVKVNDINAMTLVNAKGKTVNVNPSAIITNYNDNSLVSGSSFNDSIYNYGNHVTVNSFDGNDYISSPGYRENVTINAGDGADTVYTDYVNYFSIQGGYGADSLNLYSVWYSTINGGYDDDTILVTYRAKQDSINAGAGNDKISLSGSSFFENLTITGGYGNDTVYNNKIDDGILYQYALYDGNDLITYWSANDTLSLDYRYYTRSTLGSDVVVSVGTVSDNIFTANGAVTLSGAKTKTVNIVNGTLFEPNLGKYIYNLNDKSLLSGSAYADTVYNYGDTVTVNTGNGADTIYNSKGDRTSINAGNGDDSIYGNNDYVTINAGDGSDTISGNHYYSKLFGDAGNDSINITNYWGNTVDGGIGDDTITLSGGGNHSINGGTGADRISINSGSSYTGITVKGGTDNDVIYNTAGSSAGVLYQYAKGDGYDLIYNYGSNDTISITGANSWSTQLSGNDVLINIADSGTITLNNAKDLTLNIYPKKAEVTPQDVIKKLMKSLDTTTDSGTPALNQAVNVATNGYFPDMQTAINQMVADCASSSSYTSFLKDYCDIDLDNADTGAITGSDAGGSTVKDKYSIVPESGSLNNFTGNSFTTKGLTVKLGNIPYDGNYVYTPSDLSYTNIKNDPTKNYIWQAFKTWWASSALDLIAESYGDNYGFTSSSSATTKTMYFGFFNEAADKDGGITLAITAKPGNVLAMAVNMEAYGSLIIGDEDGKRSSRSSAYLDRTLAHEMTHAVMKATVEHYNDLPQFVREGMAELTHGAENDRNYSIINLAKAANVDYLRNSLSDLSGTGTIAIGDDLTDAYAGGYMFLRYLAKQGAAHYADSSNGLGLSVMSMDNVSSAVLGGSDTSTVNKSVLTLAKEFDDETLDLNEDYPKIKTVNATALSRDIIIYGNTSANSIVSGAGNDTISANTGNDTLSGGEGNDLLIGDAGNDSIIGNEGDDTLSGGTGDDTLTGGEGNDVFNFKNDSGNDVIADYTADEDKIKISEGTIVNSAVKGDDIVFALEMNSSITVKNGKGKYITVIDENGDETTEKYSTDEEDTTVILTDKKQSPMLLESGIKTADASNAKFAVKITGNTEDNSIVGGTKNDTLSGTTGDNTLTGGDGNDIFICGDGNDTITDYTAGKDKISLGSAKIERFSVEDSNVILSLDYETSLTLQNAAEKKISFVDGKKTSTRIYSANGLLNDKQTAITLSKQNFSATTYGGLVTVDGAQISDASIEGNAKDNIIIAGTGNNTLTGGGGKDTFVYGGGNDTITDYTAGKDKISLGSSQFENFSVEDSNVILKFGNGKSLTIQDSAGKKISFVNGKKTDVKIFTAEKITNEKGTAITLPAETSEFTADANLVSIDGSMASDKIKITGNDKANYLVAGNNGSILDGGNGNDILSGGTGADVFNYASSKKSGKDVIQNFGEEDSLDISGATVTNAAFNAKTQDVVFTLSDKNTITFKKSSDEISFADEESNTKYFSANDQFIHDGNSVTIPAAFNPRKNVVVTLEEDISIIDAHFSAKTLNLATKNNDGVSIVGGTKNDTLKGGDGADTLWGGKGNDFLYGNDGADTFKYTKGDGADVIYGFGNDDLLEIIGLGTKAAGTFNKTGTEFTVKAGTTTVAVLKNFNATTFNVNADGTSYQFKK